MTTAYRCRQLASMVRHGEVVRVAEVAELLEELAKLKDETEARAAKIDPSPKDPP